MDMLCSGATFCAIRAISRPSFRAEQADFFFRFRSCESVGLRREKSLFVLGTGGGACLILYTGKIGTRI